jgi:16S rRNA processing protein RimM
MITVGRIIRPHGHKGLVVVAPETDYPDERFEVGSELFVRRGDVESKVRILESREYRGRWVVALEGVLTMNDAEALRGTNLRVPADELFELEDGTYIRPRPRRMRSRDATGERVGLVVGRPVWIGSDRCFRSRTTTALRCWCPWSRASARRLTRQGSGS